MDRDNALEAASRLLDRYSGGLVELEEAAGSPLIPQLLGFLMSGQQARASEIARAIAATCLYDQGELFDLHEIELTDVDAE